MARPRAPCFRVLRANIPRFIHRMLEVSASLTMGELDQLLKKMDRLCRARSSRSTLTFNHLTSSIYLSETDRGVLCPLSVPVAIHAGV